MLLYAFAATISSTPAGPGEGKLEWMTHTRFGSELLGRIADEPDFPTPVAA